MPVYKNRQSTRVVRALRRRQTSAELHLWYKLRNYRFYGYKFRRQHSIGRFIVDFVCLERKLVIELDGDMHGLRKNQDVARGNELSEKGFLVLRFWNHAVKDSLDWCLSNILMGLERDIMS